MNRKIARLLGDDRGFTLVEIMVAMMILLVALLTLSTMFPMGYRQIADAGRLTVAVTGARHILEDIGDVPFNNISSLDGVDTSTNAGIIAGLGAPESAIARRWRYMLAGSGDGFAFSAAETTAWGTVQPFGGSARVWVNDATNCPGPVSTTLRRACVTITVPSTPPTTVTLSTIIVRMF